MYIMNQTPYSQMQQLVSHWNTLMKPPSKKRSRDEVDDVQDNLRQKIQDSGPSVSNETPQYQTRVGHEPIAYSFS